MLPLITRGGTDAELSVADMRDFLQECVSHLPRGLKKALIVPPDFSRFHSGAGEVCSALYSMLAPGSDVSLLPALGTHRAMTASEIDTMFPGVPHERILIHDWQKDLACMGEVPGTRLKELSGGKVDYPVRVEVDPAVADPTNDVIFSVGQVVPHEVAGMAGGNKNILVGTAGGDTINKSHFLGAVCDMETIMGRVNTPVRALFNEAEDKFLGSLPLVYILIVRGVNSSGRLVTRGLFAGGSRDSYERAARLSQEVNITRVPRLDKAVVFLDTGEFKSTWLGNKAVYRTRMAIADRGELLILAPGLVEFGEAEVFDRLIRKYGYRGTEATLRAVADDPELRDCLGAAAHLIHGSSEGRFKITYAPGGLSRGEIEGAGFEFADLAAAMKRYDPEKLKDGFNTMPDGERIYYISNPAIGLWQAG